MQKKGRQWRNNPLADFLHLPVEQFFYDDSLMGATSLNLAP